LSKNKTTATRHTEEAMEKEKEIIFDGLRCSPNCGYLSSDRCEKFDVVLPVFMSTRFRCLRCKMEETKDGK
jgi:hypothetical protein